jgi:Tol biopolymer transport system component
MEKRKVRAGLLLAFWCVCGATFVCLHAQESTWYMKIATSSDVIFVSEDGADRRIVDDFVGLDIRGTASPDGRFVLYVDAMEGDAEIFRKDLTRQAVAKLTDNTVPDNNPVWWPDGR